MIPSPHRLEAALVLGRWIREESTRRGTRSRTPIVLALASDPWPEVLDRVARYTDPVLAVYSPLAGLTLFTLPEGQLTPWAPLERV